MEGEIERARVKLGKTLYSAVDVLLYEGNVLTLTCSLCIVSL